MSGNHDLAAFMQHEDLRATAQHISLLGRKIDLLNARKQEAWAQLLAAVLRCHEEYLMDADLADFLDGMKASYGPGFATFWDHHMPAKLAHYRVRAARAEFQRWRVQCGENERNGYWSGTLPLTPDQPRPSRGVAVVYVLFDARNEPCYVGSTGNFKARVKQHARDKPDLVRWMAYVCGSREEAYRLEDKLLKEHKPHMNKKRGR